VVEVRVDKELAGQVHLGVVEAVDLLITERDDTIRAEIDCITAERRAAYARLEPAQIEGLRPARELYHAVGVDPTKVRPSSEALLRRVLKGGELPAVNSLVDVSNLCSLDFLLPIGLHDLDQVKGAVVLRRGLPGEGYDAIGKGAYSVDGRLTAADDDGPCGSPTSDSQRSMITLSTRRCLMIVYAPGSYPLSRLDEHARAAAHRVEHFVGGHIVNAYTL
jgi:DNA/RNA-binding domain of Phe-tRNA-synthetase-like protein